MADDDFYPDSTSFCFTWPPHEVLCDERNHNKIQVTAEIEHGSTFVDFCVLVGEPGEREVVARFSLSTESLGRMVACAKTMGSPL